MELLLIRHGLPIRSAGTSGSSGSASDPALSDQGKWEAARVASWLAAEPIDAVCSSPLVRARETASPLAEACGLPVTVVDDLAEWDRDADAYIHTEDLQARNDPIWQAMASGNLIELGIDPVAFQHRVVSAIDGIATENPSKLVAVACHGGVINAYTASVVGIERILWFLPDYGGITRIRVSRTGVRSIASLNETGHLRRT